MKKNRGKFKNAKFFLTVIASVIGSILGLWIISLVNPAWIKVLIILGITPWEKTESIQIPPAVIFFYRVENGITNEITMAPGNPLNPGEEKTRVLCKTVTFNYHVKERSLMFITANARCRLPNPLQPAGPGQPAERGAKTAAYIVNKISVNGVERQLVSTSQSESFRTALGVSRFHTELLSAGKHEIKMESRFKGCAAGPASWMDITVIRASPVLMKDLLKPGGQSMDNMNPVMTGKIKDFN